MFEPDEVARFWLHVVKSESCWSWTLKPTSKGYGQFKLRIPRRNVKPHRYSYALENGEEFLFGSTRRTHELDHLCRNILCVRTSHLEWVTQAENIKRATRANWQPVCKHGHEKAVWHRIDSLGRPFCFACQRNAEARRQVKRRAGADHRHV
jgi:hypothetical protein